MSFATILVIEDEQHILQSLKTTLIAQSYTIVEAKLGDDALLKLRDNKPDLNLLAIPIVETTGPELCREIRQGSDVPIIILTVRNVEREKVMALDAGADDYLVRPVGIQELLARIRAALRRAGSLDSQPPFECGDLTIDFEYREVFVRGKRTHVTPKEFALLRLFVANLGKPLPSRRLLQLV